MKKYKKIAVLISGNGTNLQSLMDYACSDNYPALISLVISNNKDAYGLTRAKKSHVKSMAIDHRNYPSRDDFDDAIHHALMAHDIDYICLAGFMRVLGGDFIEEWQGRILNIHPSLLPGYKGLNTHQRVLNDGCHIHGCSVHFVNNGLDDGAVIAQTQVNIYPEDTKAHLNNRVLKQEIILYPRVLEWLCLGRLQYDSVNNIALLDGENQCPIIYKAEENFLNDI